MGAALVYGSLDLQWVEMRIQKWMLMDLELSIFQNKERCDGPKLRGTRA